MGNGLTGFVAQAIEEHALGLGVDCKVDEAGDDYLEIAFRDPPARWRIEFRDISNVVVQL